MNKNQVLRQIPSVNELIATDSAQSIGLKAGQKHLAELARIAIEELREELLSTQETLETSREELIERACEILKAINLREISTGVRGVINATGVIIHTNLGRAPLSTKALEKIRDVSRYCTLEYSLESGSRCKRAARSEYLIRELTGAEDALIVNNCAAAALLVLSTLAQGGETILSRGEMVEIGGDFRVPEIMAQSGTRLVEVGTTNRTRLSDYESHIHQNTRLLMRVHTSNYRIIGFTSVPTLKELSELARRTGLILYEDAGSGALVDLTSFGLEDEPVISRSIKDGADIVTFSADKLLGSLQAGLIAGRRELIERLRRSPLYRALRADKLTLAALEATLESFSADTYLEDVPVMRMLSSPYAETLARAENFISRLTDARLNCEILEGESAIGGGSAPATRLRSAVLSINPQKMSVDDLSDRLRRGDPPVIARVQNDRLLIDLRTVFDDEEEAIVRQLDNLFKQD